MIQTDTGTWWYWTPDSIEAGIDLDHVGQPLTTEWTFDGYRRAIAGQCRIRYEVGNVGDWSAVAASASTGGHAR